MFAREYQHRHCEFVLRESAKSFASCSNARTNYADVTEGSGGIWERLNYNWSDPNHIVLTTTDSNLWGGRSGHTYTLTRQPNGTTDVDVEIVRDGKNFKGKLLGAFLGIFGKAVREVVCKDPESHRGTQLRGRRGGKGVVEASFICPQPAE